MPQNDRNGGIGRNRVTAAFAHTGRTDTSKLHADRTSTNRRRGVIRFGIRRSSTSECPAIAVRAVLVKLDELVVDIEELIEELTEALGRSVDLIARRSLHPQLRDRVLFEAQSLYAA